MTKDCMNKLDVVSLFEDRKGRFWIGTLGEGLYLMDRKKESFTQFHNRPEDPFSLQGQHVYTIIEDQSGVMWVGMTSGGGVNILDPNGQQFAHFRPSRSENDGFKGKLIKSLLYDQSGQLWVGTFGEGLNQIDLSTGVNKHFFNNSLDPKSLSSNNIQSLYVDRSGNLWIGTDGGGLNVWQRSNPQRFIHYKHDAENSNSLSGNGVWAIYEDRIGHLWIGVSEGGGLNRFDRSTGEFIRYKHNPNEPSSLSYDDVRSIVEDHAGILWIGTFGGGLNRFERNNERFTAYRNNPNDSLSLSHDVLTCIYESKNGILWIGTFGGGLNKFDRLSETFKAYREKDGLPSDVVKSIQEDQNGNLWISTVRGISKFNPVNEQFKNYTPLEGLQGDEFNLGSSCQTPEGYMFFGGIDGYNGFHPDSIQAQSFMPKVLITDLRVFNQSISPTEKLNGQVILKKAINYTDAITLNHRNNAFSLEFASIIFSLQNKTQYAYRLRDLNPNWVYTDANRRFASFSHLPAGNYTFEVKASSSAGEWNDTLTSIDIIILPPWWKSGWAYSFYTIFLVLLIYFSREFTVARLKLLNQLKLERLERRKTEEVNQMKLRFFTNISHEFRTPLTLIQGPLQNLTAAGEGDSNTRRQLQLMHRNVNRLLRLINQLLDFRKQETGKLELKIASGNIVKFVKEIYLSFSELAQEKEIRYTIKSEQKSFELGYDRDQLEKVFFNLLSNAFKFTPSKGKISIELRIGEKTHKQTPTLVPNKYVEICIEDNGRGIPPKYLDSIFQRFYQIETQTSAEPLGTGIGLALSKSIVDLHYGKISVESQLNTFTRFTVALPLGIAHFQKDQLIPHFKDSEHFSHYSTEKENIVQDSAQLAAVPAVPSTDAKLLVVDDNPEVRSFIRLSLGDIYHIEEAGNGRKGLEMAEELMPALIISDVMMPEMDGIAFCKALKTNLKISHIPVILLTARTSLIFHLKGFETGADDYITKPFNPILLKARVKNLIDSRRRLREKFSQSFSSDPQEITINSTDRKLMEKAINIVSKNISDSEFDVNSLARELGMSRSVLYRKLPAIIDHSPNEFIQIMRLKQAAHLLRLHQLSVSEICYEVGFKSPKYFGKCFRKYFGTSPTEFARSTKQVF